MTKLAEAFEAQAVHCANLGSPFTARLSRLLAENLTPETRVGAALHNWPTDPSPLAGGVPLRLAGALHAIVLQGRDSDLVAVYPPNTTTDGALKNAVFAALKKHSEFILDWVQSPPQTNEIRRCNGLIPGIHVAAAHFPLPLKMTELGVSAGLNLNWDRFALEINGQIWGDTASDVRIQPEWHGPLPPNCPVTVADRAGCDLNPLRVESPEDRLRLRSYIWADQSDRITLTDNSIALALAYPPKVVQQDAEAFLRQRLAENQEGQLHVIYHSIFWQYLPREVQDRCAGMIAKAGAKATAKSPLAWLRFEGDGDPKSGALTLSLWPTGETRVLARVDFHGRWIDWTGW